MNALQEKIARYQEYCRADRELIAAHPDKQQYKNRLKNHEAKLARMKESLAKKAEPPEEPSPYTGISKVQFAALEIACLARDEAMKEKGEAFPDGFWGLMLCNEDGGPVEWEEATHACFEVYDYDNEHDYGWLSERLTEVGLPIPGGQYEFDGSGYLERWGHCAVLGWNIPLAK